MDLQPVFIVGSPRSGTTWLMWLLVHHPEVVGFQQSGLFHALAPLERWWRDEWSGPRFGKGIVTAAGGAGDSDHYARTDLATVASERDFDAHCRALAGDVLERVASLKPGARMVVEQTPENAHLAELILRALPDAAFLHLIRDPRAVYASRRSARSSWAAASAFSGDPVGVARSWCSDVRAARAIRQRTDRYRELRYEELHADSVAQLGEIHAWLGLPSDPAACQAAVEACRIGRLREAASAPEGFFRRGETEAWREELSRGELRVVEYVARDLMESLGYAREAGGDAKPLRLRAHDALRALLGPLLRGARRWLGRLV